MTATNTEALTDASTTTVETLEEAAFILEETPNAVVLINAAAVLRAHPELLK